MIELINGLLDKKRALSIDNWYNNIYLVKVLFKRKTHLIGRLQKNCKRIYTKLKKKKNKGEVYFQQNKNKILILNTSLKN